MKKMISTVLAALLALPVLAGPPGRGPAPMRHTPTRHHPVMRAAPYRRPGPWRPTPPPPPPRFEPFVAGVLGVLAFPRYQWVPGHWETSTATLSDGRVVGSTYWVPGRYVWVP